MAKPDSEDYSEDCSEDCEDGCAVVTATCPCCVEVIDLVLPPETLATIVGESEEEDVEERGSQEAGSETEDDEDYSDYVP